MPQKLTVEIINAAIAGFEQQQDRIEQQITDLRAMLPAGRIETAIMVNGSPRKRRKMSAAGKRAIAEAQRKRWAALKGQPEGGPCTSTGETKMETECRWSCRNHCSDEKAVGPETRR